MTRPTLDEYFMAIARVVSTRATCLRRAVGCVLVDARGHVLATGYNGVAAGQPHCNEARVIYGRTFYDHACAGAQVRSGEALDACDAVHAEQNALIQCRDVYAIDTCYTTTEPCVSCAKLLANTTCRRVVFATRYPGGERSKSVFCRENRGWVHLST